MRIIHNAQTQIIEQVPLDNEWILANRSKELALSISQSQLAVNGSATLNIQLYSPTLADGNRQALAENAVAQMQIGDVIQDVSLVAGVWSDSLTFVTPGSYIIRSLSHPCNELTIEVTP
jgi:hypothetical protein